MTPRGGQMSVLEDERSAQCEHDEHVAVPQQIRVQHADEEKGRHPPVMRGGSRSPVCITARGLHRDTGAEEHREDRDEFAVRQHVGGQPYRARGAVEAPGHRRVGPCRQRHREELNVHSQDAEYPDAPKSVERYDPGTHSSHAGWDNLTRARY